TSSSDARERSIATAVTDFQWLTACGRTTVLKSSFGSKPACSALPLSPSATHSPSPGFAERGEGGAIAAGGNGVLATLDVASALASAGPADGDASVPASIEITAG